MYQAQIDSRVVPYIGLYPNMILYALLLVISDLKKAGGDDIVNNSISSRDKRKSLSLLVHAKVEAIKAEKPHLFERSIDKIDEAGISCICTTDNIPPEKRSLHFVSRRGEDAVINTLPGTNIVGKQWIVIERVTEYVQVTLRSGTSILLTLRDVLRVSVNCREIACKEYDESSVKKVVERFVDIYNIGANDFAEMSTTDATTKLWAMHPTSNLQYALEKMDRLLKLLGEQECVERGLQWNGSASITWNESGDQTLLQEKAHVRWLLRIVNARVAYLVLRQEEGTDLQYVKSFTSWLDLVYEQWKLYGYSTDLDNKIYLNGEEGYVVKKELSSILADYEVASGGIDDLGMWIDTMANMLYISIREQVEGLYNG